MCDPPRYLKTEELGRESIKQLCMEQGAGGTLSAPSNDRYQLRIRVLEKWTIFYGQATKGARWMPWRWKAMKDVVSCDKPRSAAASLTGDVRMGKPGGSNVPSPPPEFIGRVGRTGGSEPSQYP